LQKIFIEIENEAKGDYMIGDYNTKIEEQQDIYIQRIIESKISIKNVNSKPSTVIIDNKGLEIGKLYPNQILEITDFISFIKKFKDNEVLNIKNIKYSEQDRLMRVGIGFELEIES
jgi:hypothetical protein